MGTLRLLLILLLIWRNGRIKVSASLFRYTFVSGLIDLGREQRVEEGVI